MHSPMARGQKYVIEQYFKSFLFFFSIKIESFVCYFHVNGNSRSYDPVIIFTLFKFQFGSLPLSEEV